MAGAREEGGEPFDLGAALGLLQEELGEGEPLVAAQPLGEVGELASQRFDDLTVGRLRHG